MVVKVLISGISASKEIKKHQQRAQMLLDSLKINYEIIDITEPGHEAEKELMRTVCKKRNNNNIALPPQFFNEDQYCGDYEDLSNASDEDNVMSFLGLEEDITIENGDASSSEGKDNYDNNVVTNGRESPVETIETEITDEVTVVEERLTINGQVIDIPPEKLLELKGHKIDLNELLISKTKPIEESHTEVPKSDTNEETPDQTTDEPMDQTERTDEVTESQETQKESDQEMKNNDKEEVVKSSSDEEEEEEEEEESEGELD